MNSRISTSSRTGTQGESRVVALVGAMVAESADETALDYFPCRYGRSKLQFRGPQRSLADPYCAVLGGTETYGKFVPHPYPALLEERLGMTVINLGCLSAGPDVFLNEAAVMHVT